jgi:hypothetical protein
MPAKWKPFTENYEKWSYEVLLPDGTMLKNGWPNAGKMHAGGKVYLPSDDIKVRKQKNIYEGEDGNVL